MAYIKTARAASSATAAIRSTLNQRPNKVGGSFRFIPSVYRPHSLRGYNAGMGSPRKSADWRIVATLVAVLLLVPILYVLSVGPALWLADHGYLTEQALVIVYFPL